MTRPVRVLLTEGFADWEAGPLVGARWSFPELEVTLHSPDGGDVTSLGGMRVTALSPFDPGPQDVAVLIGGTIWEGPEAPPVADLAARHLARGGTVAAICGALAPLARAGLLAGRRHSSNGPDWLNHVAPAYPGAELHSAHAQASQDGGLISAGGGAPVSFAVEVLHAAGVDAPGRAEIAALFAAEHRV